MNKKILKLAKLIIQFAEVESDKGVLSYTGDLAEGVEIFIEKDGDFEPAPDGEYTVEGKTITVKDGAVVEIKEPEAEPEQENEENPEEITAEEIVDEEKANLQAENETLRSELQTAHDKIDELQAKIDELQAKLDESAGNKAEDEFKKQAQHNEKNKALKYFQ